MIFQRHRKTFAQINLTHLQHNLKWIQSQMHALEFLCPMIKANAYGHGDAIIGHELERLGVRTFGVGLIEEGLWLRSQGIRGQMIVYAPFSSVGDIEIMENAKLTPVVSSISQLECLQKYLAQHSSKKISVHCEFDTGMSRLGFQPDEAAALVLELQKTKNLNCEGIFTHFHSGSDLLGACEVQRKRFSSVIGAFQTLNPKIHMLASASLIKRTELMQSSQNLASSDWQGVRPGIGLYGVHPFEVPSLIPSEKKFSQSAKTAPVVDLKPVMNLLSSICQVRKVKTGESVSYSQTWKAVKDSTIGVIPIGYGDGYPRHLSNKGHILCRDQRIPVVGNVCMDYLMVDLSELTGNFGGDQLLGEEVLLFGESAKGQRLPVEQLAQSAGTIGYEIVTRVGARVPKEILKKESDGKSE